jgi:hypothetical protein
MEITMCESVRDTMLKLQFENYIRLTTVVHSLFPSVCVDILYASIAKINMLKEISSLKNRPAKFQYVYVYFLNSKHSAEEAGFLTTQCHSYGDRTKICRDNNIYILGLSAPYSSCSQEFQIKARKLS